MSLKTVGYKRDEVFKPSEDDFCTYIHACYVRLDTVGILFDICCAYIHTLTNYTERTYLYLSQASAQSLEDLRPSSLNCYS
jgi:hypothetical protein